MTPQQVMNEAVDQSLKIILLKDINRELVAALEAALLEKPEGAAYLVWENNARKAINKARGQ